MGLNQSRIVSIFTGLFLGLSACNLPAEQEPITSNPSADCAKDQFDIYLWQRAETLDGLALPKGTRVIQPGMAVTMDFRPNRLNLAIGKTGRIERIYCG